MLAWFRRYDSTIFHMGSCVSVHKSHESAMSHRWSLGSTSTNGKPPMIPPPVHKPHTLNAADPTFVQLSLHSQCPSSCSRDTGSKEEEFFDSHVWLESDCEDDFLSINGDVTPSGANTPAHHHSSSSRKPPVMEGKLSVPEQSPQPADKSKKLLSELFKESSRNHLYMDDEENVLENARAAAEKTGSSPAWQRFTNRIPSNSDDGSGERTPLNETNNGVVRADDKSRKSAQCCLPKMMISSRSFSERKKKESPAPA